jgi:hypothetical protein
LDISWYSWYIMIMIYRIYWMEQPGRTKPQSWVPACARLCKHVQALHTTALKHHEIHSGPQSWHSYFFTGIVRQAMAGLSVNLSDPVSDDHHESCMVSTTWRRPGNSDRLTSTSVSWPGGMSGDHRLAAGFRCAGSTSSGRASCTPVWQMQVPFSIRVVGDSRGVPERLLPRKLY